MCFQKKLISFFWAASCKYEQISCGICLSLWGLYQMECSGVRVHSSKGLEDISSQSKRHLLLISG